MTLEVHAIDHIVVNVRDVEAAVRWYQAVLGVAREDFNPGEGKPTRTSIRLGAQKINLRPFDADVVAWFTGRQAVPGSEDLCFLTASAPDAVVRHLREQGVPIEVGPVTRQGAMGALRSVYCRDPDGNLIEIASYEDTPAPR